MGGIIGLNTIGLDGNVVIKRGVSGETINNQDKVVDITENGTTEVVADSGFTGLGKVTINTEVSGGESGGSNIEYLDVSGVVSKQQVVLLSTLIKIEGQILPTAVLVEVAISGIDALRPMINSINQIAVNSALEVNMGDGNVPISNLMEGYDSIPRITKEQFYDLNA